MKYIHTRLHVIVDDDDDLTLGHASCDKCISRPCIKRRLSSVSTARSRSVMFSHGSGDAHVSVINFQHIVSSQSDPVIPKGSVLVDLA